MLLLLPKVSRVVHQMIVVARWQSLRAGVEKEFASCEGAAKISLTGDGSSISGVGPALISSKQRAGSTHPTAPLKLVIGWDAQHQAQTNGQKPAAVATCVAGPNVPGQWCGGLIQNGLSELFGPLGLGLISQMSFGGEQMIDGGLGGWTFGQMPFDKA